MTDEEIERGMVEWVLLDTPERGILAGRAKAARRSLWAPRLRLLGLGALLYGGLGLLAIAMILGAAQIALAVAGNDSPWLAVLISTPIWGAGFAIVGNSPWLREQADRLHARRDDLDYRRRALEMILAGCGVRD